MSKLLMKHITKIILKKESSLMQHAAHCVYFAVYSTGVNDCNYTDA